MEPFLLLLLLRVLLYAHVGRWLAYAFCQSYNNDNNSEKEIQQNYTKTLLSHVFLLNKYLDHLIHLFINEKQ
jgi:hypothetical protein